MSLQRVLVIIHEDDPALRRQVAASVTRVLAEYPGSLLVEADERQIAALRRKGLTIETQQGARMIRLRTVEFSTDAPPETPAALTLSPAERRARAQDYWIVQFIGPAKEEWTAAIRALGGVIGNYIPENAYLVEMTEQARAQVERLPFVTWVGPYEPAYKVSPLLLGQHRRLTPDELGVAEVDTTAFQPTPEGNVTVMVHAAPDLGKVAGQIEALGGTVVTRGGNTITASLDPERIGELTKMAEVKWVEPFELPVTNNDVAAGIMQVQPVWETHGLDGDGQIVAVADTGLDVGADGATMHQDFQGRIVAIHDRVGDGANDVNSGHGTHVAGSVLGGGNRSSGDIRGMAHHARLVFQAIENNSTGGLAGIPTDYNQLFQQAYDDGARIHTNSWGNHQHGQYTAASQDIDEFIWNHKDMLILFSASNDGIDADHNGTVDQDSLSAQACAKNCVTVGASENNRSAGGYNPGGACDSYGSCWPGDFPSAPLHDDPLSDDPEGMVAFSGRGPTDDGRIKPDVVAPGTNILSVRSSSASGHGWGLLPTTDARRPYYMYMGGTSMATPLTAGTVALIREYLVRVRLHTPSAALLKALLLHGASALSGQYPTPEVGTVPNNSEGWGRVNLQNTLFPAYPAFLDFRDSAADALGTGEQRSYTFTVVDSSVPFRATLVWSDFPSDPTVGGALVNQLRLSVIRPNGTTLNGAPANNNVQRVTIDSPATGTYTVRVTGISVPTVASVGQRQDFALAVTAGLECVDLYIKDNAADDGVEPSAGVLCQSPDIWISLTNDPAAPAQPNPEYGQTNYVFIRVHNRGPQAAASAQVRLYWANAGTNLSKPYWKTDGIKVDGAAGNLRSVDVPGHGAGGDGQAICAAFEWTPPDPATNIHQPGHFCLFATVTHPNDPLLQEDVDAVRWEDNLAWKNVIVKDTLANAETTMEFYVAGLAHVSSLGQLHIDRAALPPGSIVKLKIPSRWLDGAQATNLQQVWQSEGGRVCRVAVTGATADLQHIALQPGENTLVFLEVTLPATAQHGYVYPVWVEQVVNGQTKGRVTLNARFVGTPAYIANAHSLEIHLPQCEWVARMGAGHKLPYDDIHLALQRGYNGCRFCMPEYDRG